MLLLQKCFQNRAAQEHQDCEVSDEGVGTPGVPAARVEVAVVAGLAGITDRRYAIQHCLARRAALADVLNEVEACRAVRSSLLIVQTLSAQALGLGGALDDPLHRIHTTPTAPLASSTDNSSQRGSHSTEGIWPSPKLIEMIRRTRGGARVCSETNKTF